MDVDKFKSSLPFAIMLEAKEPKLISRPNAAALSAPPNAHAVAALARASPLSRATMQRARTLNLAPQRAADNLLISDTLSL